MRKYILFFKSILIVILSISCTNLNDKGNLNKYYENKNDIINIEKISNSIWRNTVLFEKCADVLKIKENKTFSYDTNCEVKDSIYGSWKIDKDTLILKTEGSYYDINSSEFSPMLWKLILLKDTLMFVYSYSWNYNLKKFNKREVLKEDYNKLVRLK